jgi:hypothetical protein
VPVPSTQKGTMKKLALLLILAAPLVAEPKQKTDAPTPPVSITRCQAVPANNTHRCSVIALNGGMTLIISDRLEDRDFQYLALDPVARPFAAQLTMVAGDGQVKYLLIVPELRSTGPVTP